jgi:uncharacterized protein
MKSLLSRTIASGRLRACASGWLQVPLNRVDILSIGTTSEPIPGAPLNGGFAAWLKGARIINLLMYAHEQGIMALAASLAGRARMLRVDQMTVPGTVSLDNIGRIPDLVDFGLRAGQIATPSRTSRHAS